METNINSCIVDNYANKATAAAVIYRTIISFFFSKLKPAWTAQI